MYSISVSRTIGPGTVTLLRVLLVPGAFAAEARQREAALGQAFSFEHADIIRLYPRLEEFRALCVAHDRNGVLRNGYTARVLNLPPGPPRDKSSGTARSRPPQAPCVP